MRPGSNPYRVYIVDDSRTIRRLIGAIVEETDGLALAGTADCAEQALDLLRDPDLLVDVVSLDIELPGMNGLEFLTRLMAERPLPVLVISGHTDTSADLSVSALEHGAIDCIQKPDGRPDEINRFVADTAEGLLRAAQSNRAMRHGTAASGLKSEAANSRVASSVEPAIPDAILCIGASTGGVPAVCKVIAGVAALRVPIVVVQHMPPNFTGRLASRLSQTTGLPAAEAQHMDRLTPGHIWVAPGGRHLTVERRGGFYVAHIQDGDPVSGHRPSIDVMFSSVAHGAGVRAVGVLLTGMGRDGAEGLLSMRKAGAVTITQDAASSVVFGMPKAAAALGAADYILPLDRIAGTVSATLSPTRATRVARPSSGVRHG